VAGCQFGVLTATNRLGRGDKIRLISGHCDPTANPRPSLPASGAGFVTVL